jgi:hypothetical protein
MTPQPRLKYHNHHSQHAFNQTLLSQSGTVISFDISSTVSFHSIFCTFWPSADLM